jgi:menaquinone-specific isochorismate synthase
VRAVTRRLDDAPDLVDVAGEEGVLFQRGRSGIAGHGVAARVALGDAAVALDAIEVDDEVGRPGTGPVAFGAIPFRPGAPAEAIIPTVVVGRDDDGTAWCTQIAVDPPTGVDIGQISPIATPVGAGARSQGVRPSRFGVAPSRPAADWCAAVAVATTRIRDRRLAKVVLAREVVVTADAPFDVIAVLRRLHAAYAGCFVYSVDGFVGASPELLVARSGDVVRSHPMAGTAPRSGDPTTDARLAAGLLASAKMRDEHQITIDMVHDTLLPWCSYVDYEAEPSVVAMANVQHLATMVEGRLSDPPPSVVELVRALHPTPAVCGWPRDEALALIDELELLDRGHYAGAVGWVDRGGNGAWAVAIRCAFIEGATARLFAGNGIVADSDPDAELAETQAKFQALLHALVRP